VAQGAGSPCLDCTLFNKTWVLGLVSPCVWTSGDADVCGGVGPTWTLTCNATDWVLTTPGIGTDPEVGLTHPRLGWACMGCNTLTRSPGVALQCDGFPTSITVCPV
jgi:hypothetical protein